jgi:hypothetical protein
MDSVTTNELLQYVYKETYLQRSLAIKAAIEDNKRLRKEYLEIELIKESLDKVVLISPRKEAIDKILNYAKESLKKNSKE